MRDRDGIAWVPFFFAANEPTLRRIGTECGGMRDLWLVVHPDLARVGRIRTVMDFLIEIVAMDAALFAGDVPRTSGAASPSRNR